jgi:hypothetical protein
MVFARKIVQNGSRKKFAPIIKAKRSHATSTMDLVSADESSHRHASIASTVQFKSAERDYSAMSRRRVMESVHYSPENFVMDDYLHVTPCVTAAHELDLIEASERLHLYDKMLFLLSIGEYVQIKSDASSNRSTTEILTGRGVGHALSLSRRIATFCNEENGLIPELFVLEPSQKAAQTGFLSFPYDTPYSSLRGTRWICHPSASITGVQQPTSSSLNLHTVGIDCSLLSDNNYLDVHSSNNTLEETASNLLHWVYGRDEKIIVGKFVQFFWTNKISYVSFNIHAYPFSVVADTLLLQGLGNKLRYQGSKSQFQSAEMRAVGVCFR